MKTDDVQNSFFLERRHRISPATGHDDCCSNTKLPRSVNLGSRSDRRQRLRRRHSEFAESRYSRIVWRQYRLPTGRICQKPIAGGTSRRRVGGWWPSVYGQMWTQPGRGAVARGSHSYTFYSPAATDRRVRASDTVPHLSAAN